jgi:hypothetical protein
VCVCVCVWDPHCGCECVCVLCLCAFDERRLERGKHNRISEAPFPLNDWSLLLFSGSL